MKQVLAVIGILALLSTKTFAGSEGDVAASQLLALTNQAVIVDETSNQFRMDGERPKNVSMLTLTNAVIWTADMDIDSDGRETPLCNKKRDPWHQNQLSCGTDIAADETPYFVIPIGKPANYQKRGIEIGQVAAIVYSNQVAYAIFLDECGDRTLIGEASIATANILGVDSDPRTGGTDGPVTYIVFTGESGRITDPKDYADHKKVVEIGVRRTRQLLAESSGTNLVATAPAPSKK
jgi:Fungal chitosanase of glycosyl hydrolase group 75